jgi:putative endonuclease
MVAQTGQVLHEAGAQGKGPQRGVRLTKAERGRSAYHAGLTAEDQVARLYLSNGRAVCARRWRGSGGEIDLVARDGDRVIFIEVKQSRTHAAAAAHLSERQMQRIWAAGSEFLAGEPRGSLTDVQIDVALVDGMGRIEIVENAYAA